MPREYTANDIRAMFHVATTTIAHLRRRGIVTPRIEPSTGTRPRHIYTESDVRTIQIHSMNAQIANRAHFRRGMVAIEKDTPQRDARGASRCCLCDSTALYLHPRTREGLCRAHREAKR